jgi:hypothetical protein
MKLLSLLILLIFLLVNVSGVSGQRCGDFLWVSLNDRKGHSINPSKYKNIKIYTKAYDVNDRNKMYENEVNPEIKSLEEGTDVLSIRTICGLIEAKFDLEYQDQKMTIIIQDIPGDSGNIILKDLQFSQGKYQINIGGRKLDNCQLEHDTIISGSRIISEKLWSINSNNFHIIKNSD